MAGRKPKVNYYASRGGYYCWFRGQQRLLAKGPDDAVTGPTYLQALEDRDPVGKQQTRRQEREHQAYGRSYLGWSAATPEMENDRRAHIRFGDDVSGQGPSGGASFTATYRVGGGRAGNVGADALTRSRIGRLEALAACSAAANFRE